jgi:hypothetical protein
MIVVIDPHGFKFLGPDHQTKERTVLQKENKSDKQQQKWFKTKITLEGSGK